MSFSPLLGVAAPDPAGVATAAPASSAGAAASSGQPTGGQEMAAIIAGIIANNDLSVAKFDNERRAVWLRAQPTAVDPARRNYDEFVLAVELQRAGRLEEAISTLQTVRTQMSADGAPLTPGSDLADVTSQLAASWLRLGEVENCAVNNTIDSCLLPIQGKGVHTLEKGSRGAMRELERLLRVNPGDLTSRWMLNVAAMTLGEYPDKVPPEFLIPPSAFVSEDDIGRFTDVAMAVGVARPARAGGSAMDDFDGDGDLDIVMSSVGLNDPLTIYMNRGDGTFEDTTSKSALDGITGGLNLIHADYDNDGDLDVFVLRGGWMSEQGLFPNSLLANRGDGTFDDVTIAAGLLSFHPTQTGAWADYDNDGFLDLFIGNETREVTHPHPDELYRNNHDGTFTNVAVEAKVSYIGFAKAVVWGDYDDDGDPDLYISQLNQPNVLLRNDAPEAGGVRHFTDVSEAAGVTQPLYSFPNWFWDYDNDGHLDIFVSGYGNRDHFLVGSAGDVAADYLGLPTNAERPRLYHNRGDGTFEDVTKAAGLWHVFVTMGSNFGDLDNDGWEDFYVGTGDPDYRTLIPNRMFRNSGAGTFHDVTTSGGFGHLQKGHGVSFGDIDNDGDQDVHAEMGGQYGGDWYQNVLYENPGHHNRWITLRLQGVRSNRSAIGARIRVDVVGPSGTRSIHRAVSTGGSFGGNSLQQEIGLGDATAIERVVVSWPTSGIEQIFEAVALDRAYSVREDAPALDPIELAPINLADPMADGVPMAIPPGMPMPGGPKP